MKDMQDIGLVKIRYHKENKNIKAVKLEVDFSLKQPEEEEYEKALAQRAAQPWDEWEESTETKREKRSLNNSKTKANQQLFLETTGDQDKPIKKEKISKYPPEFWNEGWDYI